MIASVLYEIRDLLIEVRDLLKDKTHLAEDAVVSVRPRPHIVAEKNFSWDSYIKEKQPKNDYEIIALIVAHLIEDTKASVTRSDIVDFVHKNPAQIKNTKTSALEQAIRDTKGSKSYGYIEYVSKKDKTYILSIRGKQLVAALPDRLPANVRSRKKTKSKSR